jgi:hypothetical protein
MTHVFSVQSRDTLWVVADRRLSCKGLPPKDDAVKVVSLETGDGVGVLAYAGLGAEGYAAVRVDERGAARARRPGHARTQRRLV